MHLGSSLPLLRNWINPTRILTSSSGGLACVQVAQVLLTLPYSFSQLGMVSGLLLQVFYGLMGSWTAYLISVLYVEYRARKEKQGVSFKNHVIQVGRSASRSLHSAGLLLSVFQFRLFPAFMRTVSLCT